MGVTNVTTWNDAKMMPPRDFDTFSFSADVLVFGYVLDPETDAKTPCFGIGYVDTQNKWYIATVNGLFFGAEIDYQFVLLSWQPLPDAPQIVV